MAEEEEAAPADETPRLKRIQIRPGLMPVSMESPNYLRCTPTIPKGPQEYKPILYTFRVKSTQYNSRMTAKNVPFYVQLDHCIAVVWSLFSAVNPTKTIGIAQLQWALTFLKTIYTSQGLRPKDVEFCIEVIEDILVNKYADLSMHLTSLDDIDSAYGPNISKNEMKPHFSPNYNEMMKNCPVKTRKICPMTEKFYMTDEEIMGELESIKKAAGIDTFDLETMPREKAIDVLSTWKAKQVEKIQNELRLLRCIEDTIKCTDADNFTGYTDEALFNP